MRHNCCSRHYCTLHTKAGVNGHVADPVFITLLIKLQVSAGGMNSDSEEAASGRRLGLEQACCKLSTHGRTHYKEAAYNMQAKQNTRTLSPPTCEHTGLYSSPVGVTACFQPLTPRVQTLSHNVAESSAGGKKAVSNIQERLTWDTVKHEVIREGWGRAVKWSGAMRSWISAMVQGTWNGK